MHTPSQHDERATGQRTDFVGFECPVEFVVGYGMDWANRFRSLKHVCVVKRGAYGT